MKHVAAFSAILTILFLSIYPSDQVFAENSGDGNAVVDLTLNEEEGIRDPENPGTIVDPGETPSTSGKLRLDFVPQLNFGQYKRSDKDQLYPVNGQLFLDETSARGTFIQVADFRGGAQGWALQVRQETQFKNDQTTNTQLNGAVISFDKSWTNSVSGLDNAPTVSKDIIRLSNIGDTYNLAEAKPGTGNGIWSIAFGASADNAAGAPATLSPRMQEGKAVTDSVFNNQQTYENIAVQLSVPGGTKKDPVNYSTVLTWILAELP
ncbi:WxL domain-containing protein [Enterococcus sp. LJL51]|uniref:WxL domain-containing protein n=1 Tax=Enterococcus sp. LJL51 TaxID=3416656 RepID=UPI003CF91D9A